jgi:hypothetical protein
VVDAQSLRDLSHGQVGAGAALAELVEEGLQETIASLTDRRSHPTSVNDFTTVE